nr:PQQ-dependent sugar dehydrogenase [Actinokineospora inagensis]
MLVLSSPGTSGAAPSSPATGLTVQTVASGLVHPWDVGFLPDGKIIIPQRIGTFALLSGSTVREIKADTADIQVKGEGGLMGLVVHPDFTRSRQFTTCQTHQENGKPVDIRLVTWSLSRDGGTATKVKDLLTGLPLSPAGRHSGCRPTLAADGALLVGTGDTANPTVSQDLHALGGKVLRINLKTGKPLPDNPFPGSPVYNYGHRNVQGVALRADGRVLTAEHGPDKNDEVNLNLPGANYGWDPSRGGTSTKYDESVPMTDLDRFPNAVPAKWQSGDITEAISGATFLGHCWGPLEGTLVIAALKGAKAIFLTVDKDANVTGSTIPPELQGFGRLRAARTAPDGSLYLTTSNGTDDKVLRVTPATK